jgi:hypothetical protein
MMQISRVSVLLALVACGHRSAPVVAVAPKPVAPLIVVDRVPANAIRGIVVFESGAPMAQARVTLDNKLVTVTDSIGRFQFADVAPGRHLLRFMQVNYVQRHDSVDVVAGTGTTVFVPMYASAVQLTEVCAGTGKPAVTVRVHPVSVLSIPNAGGNIPRGAVVRVSSGQFVERFVVESVPPSEDGIVRIRAGWDQPGDYSVVVEAPGYAIWKRSDIHVKRIPCSIDVQFVDVSLERLR